MSIRLSPTHGVNPTLTYCPQCGKESNALYLVGYAGKYKCSSCGQLHIGRPRDGRCAKCGSYQNFSFFGEFDGSRERLPGPVCGACEKKQKAADDEVEAGGVYFRCKKCGSAGAVRAEHPLSKAVRAKLGIDPPGKCGVELDECPVCQGKQDEKETDSQG